MLLIAFYRVDKLIYLIYIFNVRSPFDIPLSTNNSWYENAESNGWSLNKKKIGYAARFQMNQILFFSFLIIIKVSTTKVFLNRWKKI